jgi:purine-cytosine permease-like protein
VLAIAGGSIAGVLFLVGLLVGETDEAFADMYSGAVALQNIAPRVPYRVLVVAIAAIGATLAASLTMERYEVFLFLIGSVFVPLLGILAADHFIIRRGVIDTRDLYRTGGGGYWYTGGTRIGSVVAWLLGVLVYHWIVPTGPAWWTDWVRDVVGTPLSERFTWLGASIPSFLVAFAIALVVGTSQRVSSRPTDLSNQKR